MTLPTPGTPAYAVRFAAIARLREDVRRTADRLVARARAARRQGATADAYRISAEGLDRQANRAEELLFDRAVEVFRAAAAENRLIADALEVLEGRTGL
jgi:hypothetical protein